MKKLNLMLVTLLSLFTGSAFAQNTFSENVAKSAINQYVITKSLQGGPFQVPGTPETPKIGDKALCKLVGQAIVGFTLLRGKTDAEIEEILELVEESEIPALRQEVEDDSEKCI